VRCAGEPSSVSLCHCLACQKRTGSTFGIAAFFPAADVTISGRSTTYVRTGDAGHDVVFHFCAECGSTVWWEPRRKPGVIAIAVGAFADPSFPAPSKSVFEEHRHPWVALPV
jgi:hypothetical protein